MCLFIYYLTFLLTSNQGLDPSLFTVNDMLAKQTQQPAQNDPAPNGILLWNATNHPASSTSWKVMLADVIDQIWSWSYLFNDITQNTVQPLNESPPPVAAASGLRIEQDKPGKTGWVHVKFPTQTPSLSLDNNNKGLFISLCAIQ